MGVLWRCAVVIMLAYASVGVAHADPSGQNNPPIECPDTHAHVWHADQCDDITTPFTIPGSGVGHGGSGGLLGLIGHLL